MNKVVAVGCGFSGAILAREIAEQLRIKVHIIERRNHIAGNMYDEKDEHGILVQHYGPHYLNTNHYSIIRYLSKFSDFFRHEVRMLSFIDGNYIQLPFNFLSVQQLIGAEKAEALLAKLRAAFYGRDRVPILELVDHEDHQISEYGTLLFEKAYRTYTSKMWGIQPEQIDKYVLERVPMAMSYDERYLNKDFQYLPTEGFTKLFEKMLDHPNIEVRLNTDALPLLRLEEETGSIFFEGEKVDCLIYTGAIDELFGLKYGLLPYRSLDIRYEYDARTTSALPSEIISYPQANGYTRRTEYHKLMKDSSQVVGSIVATEYPLQYDPNAAVGNVPYYPVMTEESGRLYQMYLEDVKKYKDLFLCGRLAEFKYYNMDICIEHALSYFEHIKTHLSEKRE